MKHTPKQLLLLCLSVFFSGQLLADPGKTDRTTKQAPISFIENKGQVTDQDRKARKDIQFCIKATSGLSIFIGNGAIHYQFCKETFPRPAQKERVPDHKNGTLLQTSITMDRMDVELIGANKNAKVVAEGKIDYSERYFTGQAGAKEYNVPAYDRITYKNIYPGIDWVLYIRNGLLEHEFVVRTGGKVSDIQLKYGGAEDLKINEDGSLTALTPQGTITEHAPETYQKGKIVSSSFVLKGNMLGYATGKYRDELVIDPTLTWATYYGGSNTDQGNSVATDASGNVFIAGNTSSSATIATSGAYHTILSGTTDAFLAKLNSNGAMLWATYYGGSAVDEAYGVATDASGNVYLTGYTGSASGIATPGAHQVTFAGGTYDVFLAKFTTTGSLLWSTYYGGPGKDIGTGIATDASGNVYITGTSASTSGMATPGSYQTVLAGGSVGDAFLAKFNSAGTIQWATYFGGPDNDNGMGVATDTFGSVCLTGITYSTTGIATLTASQPALGGIDDAFLARFNAATGAIQWATYFGSAGNDDGYSVATDPYGNIYMTGWTNSTINIATPGAYQTSFGGGTSDAFLSQFDSSGYLGWSTYYGGSSQDYGYSLANIGTGNIYLTGRTSSLYSIATPGAVQPALGGSDDGYLANFSTAGNLLWATYFGGGGIDYGTGIAHDDSGNVYIAGYTGSTSAIAGYGIYQNIYGGGTYDAFLAKYNFFCVVLPIVPPITGIPVVCPGDTLMVADAAPGGTWTCRTTHETVSGWIITGVSAGLDTVLYTLTNTCGATIVSLPVTVNPLPYAGVITGIDSVCMGSSVTLTDIIPGGIWGSVNPHATVSGGITTGVSTGHDTISYSVTNSCGTAIALMPFTVITLPAVSAISGFGSALCPGWSVYYTDPTPGGVWSTSNTHATVSGGHVSSVSPGTDTVFYTVTNICGSTPVSITVTVNPLPDTGTITGPSTVCTGDSVTLNDTATGGIWSSSSAHTTVSGGRITGVSAGTSVISYTVTNSCGTLSTTKNITIPGLPVVAAITGPDSVCPGDSVVLLNDSLGGKWSSSAATIAKADSITGTIKGLASGTATITYTVTNICGATARTTFTINVLTRKYCNTAVNGMEAQNSELLSVFPNPNSGSFTLKLTSGLDEEVQVTITNVIGQKVKEFKTITNKDYDFHMYLDAGIYILNAATATGSRVAKVIIN